MSRQLIILGHNGMLGQMAILYFSKKNYEIFTTDVRFSEDNLNEFKNFIHRFPNAVILNCIGRIKQKSSDYQDLFWTNTFLPLFLKSVIKSGQILIHPSTDCVFSGEKLGKKNYYDSADASDIYGISKYLGEVALQSLENALIVRTSIIGIENGNTGKGLLAWFLSQPSGSRINGFVNHYWNGITTLEWCKQIDQIISDFDLYRKIDLIQLGLDKVYNKYEMLHMFQSVFNTNYTIDEFSGTETIDRSLNPTHKSKKLIDQLVEMKLFVRL
jgi:dTDP-4-dehydrorhamnose reductase